VGAGLGGGGNVCVVAPAGVVVCAFISINRCVGVWIADIFGGIGEYGVDVEDGEFGGADIGACLVGDNSVFVSVNLAGRF
jgi:hypothetical protein